MNLPRLHRAEPSQDFPLATGEVSAQSALESLEFFADLPEATTLFPTGNLPALEEFLRQYRQQQLLGWEFPLVLSAYDLAREGKYSELLALDREMGSVLQGNPFAVAGKRAGRIQVKRFRSFREQRGLQKYLTAVNDGQANAWHPMVYGIFLASFSIPLRQGLFHYAEQVMSAFFNNAFPGNELVEGSGAFWNLLDQALLTDVESALKDRSVSPRLTP